MYMYCTYAWNEGKLTLLCFNRVSTVHVRHAIVCEIEVSLDKKIIRYRNVNALDTKVIVQWIIKLMHICKLNSLRW